MLVEKYEQGPRLKKQMRKVWIIIGVLICSHQTLPAQNKLDFRQIPEVLNLDTIDKIETANFKPCTEKDFLRSQVTKKSKIETNTTIKMDSDGHFMVRTKKSYYELLNQSSNYISSYQYMGYLPAIRSHLIGFCGSGMCESYLLDNETDVKMVLPSSFDAGSVDLLISPSNNWMLVYSSHDGPDYVDYYSFRSELIIYKIEKDKGIQGLKPFKSFQTSDWSMQEIV